MEAHVNIAFVLSSYIVKVYNHARKEPPSVAEVYE